MGNHPLITATEFPKQGSWLGKRTRVCFHYDTSTVVGGTIVRDDVYVSEEIPCHTIIALDDGRYVLTTECQHSPEA